LRKELLKYVRCPVDGSELSLSATRVDDDGHIIEGTLTSGQGIQYPINRGVPNLLPPDENSVVPGLSNLSSRTQKHFGYEWTIYNRWGWLDDYPDNMTDELLYVGALKSQTVSTFWSKTLLDESELGGQHLVLDGGCGNGRFLNIVQEYGVSAIGVDLGPAVYAAFENTRHMPNVHIVRGDLLQLPFNDRIFDRIYSIGVLMHTGDASKSFDSLAQYLKQGGLFSVRVYGKGLPIYEALDVFTRAVILKCPIPVQMLFSRVTAGFTRWLRNGGSFRNRVYRRLKLYYRMQPTPHHTFDWWAAPIATHHTLDEVLDWYQRNGLIHLDTKPKLNDEKEARHYKRNNLAITVKGKLTDK